MTKPVLHGVNPSPFVRKVRVALAEKGIEYDQVPVMPGMASPEYKEISPFGKIPCYVEGDFALPDSSAIVAYLERKQPTPALYPEDAQEFGRALWLEEYADSKLADNVGGVFFNRVVQVKLFKGEPDQARIAEALEALEGGSVCLLCGGQLDQEQLQAAVDGWKDEAILEEGGQRAETEGAYLDEEEEMFEGTPDFGDEGEDEEDPVI